MPFEIKLKGKTALVTGAARGIGSAIATQLAAAGANIIVNDLREGDCAQTVQEVKAKGVKAKAIAADISNKSQVEAMIQEAAASYGGLDLLVNNAGTVARRSALELSEEEWDTVLDVNLKGTFLCSQAAAKQMKKECRGGKILNISSMLGAVALPPRSAYSASKGGVIALTRDLALEFAQYNIKVNAVAPGWVRTEVREKYFAEKGVSEFLLDRIPLKRFCEPSEVASLVVFLASDYADYITGQTVVIDGGWTAL